MLSLMPPPRHSDATFGVESDDDGRVASGWWWLL